MVHHYFSQHGVLVFIALAAVILGHSCGRDLRPSDHGLTYQEQSLSPTTSQNGDEQEMLAFFGTTTSSSSSSVQLPEAKNISDTLQNAHVDEGQSRGLGRDHVKLGLLVASAVCGLTGVLLLVVSGVVFLIRLQKQKPKAERIPSTAEPAFVAHAATETL